jgi:signal transduction histidine kinase
VKGESSYISAVHYTPLDYIPVIYTGLPVNFTSGESRVVVFEAELSDIWQRIDMTTIGETGIAYAVSRQGTIIAHPEPGYVGRRIPAEISPVLESYEGFTEYYDPYKQREVIAAYSPVGGSTGWGIVVEQEKGEAYETIRTTGESIAIIFLALGLVGTASIYFLIRNFMRPIKDLTRTARNIAQTGYLKKMGTVPRPDEIGQLSQAFDQMIERINQAQRAKEEATMVERTRLARELHDAVSQTLFSASLIAEVLPRIWERNPEEGRKRLEEVRQLTRGALAEMRTLLFELRPAALQDVDIRDLLKQLGESVTGRSRIPVTLEINGECELPLDVKIALYRLCQEALNNIVKHAQASRPVFSWTVQKRASSCGSWTTARVLMRIPPGGQPGTGHHERAGELHRRGSQHQQ